MRFKFLNEDIESLKYYGSGDLAGSIFVKTVVDSIATLESNISKLNDEINDLEDLYRYLWLLSFKEMVSEIDNYKVPNEIKERIKKLNESLDYCPKRFIEYINKNFEDVLDKTKVDKVRWDEFYDILFELIFNKYSNGIKSEVFEFIEKKYALNILACFSKYSDYYNKNKESIKNLFNNLENTNVFDDQIYTTFLINNKIKDTFYIKKAEFICGRSIKYIKKFLNLSAESKEIYQIQNLFLEYRTLAIIYNLKCTNEYNEYKNAIDEAMNRYLIKQVQPINLNIKNFEIISKLKETKEKWKFLQLTHFFKNEKFVNNLDKIFNEKPKSSSTEFNRIGVAKSEKYPYFKQDAMSSNLLLNIHIINIIFIDRELSKEFAN